MQCLRHNRKNNIPTSKSNRFIHGVLIVLLGFLTGQVGWSQKLYDIDSLKQELERTTSPVDHASLLIYLSNAYRFVDKELSEEYAIQALTEAQILANDTLIADSYFQLEQVCFFRDDYELALFYLDSAILLYQKINAHYMESMALRVKGNILSFMGKYNDAYEVLLMALERCEKEEDKDGANSTKLLLATVLDYVKEYDQSELLYKEAISYLDTLSDDMYYYEDISFGLTYYGMHLDLRERYDEALEKFKETERLAKRAQDPYGELIAIVNTGLLYADLEQYDSSEYYCDYALAMSKEYEDLFEEQSCYKCLGITYAGQGRNSEAEKMFLMADQLANAIEVPQEQMEIKKHLANFYKKQGAFEKALAYQEEYKVYSDSTFNTTKAAQFSLLQTKFNIAEKEKMNKGLQEKLKNKTRQNALYLVGILLAAVFIVVLYLVFLIQQNNKNKLEHLVTERTKELKESNEMLWQANQELKEFAYITSHDLKEPIRNINSYAYLTSRKIKDSKLEEATDFLEYISKSAIQLNDLVNDVYNFVRLEEIHVTRETFLLTDLVETISTDLHKLGEKRKGIVSTSFIRLTLSKNLLKLILKNLIQNGWKYNKNEEALVQVSCQETDEVYQFEVSDNGIGIAHEFHEHVFKMFKRLHSRGEYTGSGLGLSICKKIITKMGGDISIKTPGIGDEGIVVSFSIPK